MLVGCGCHGREAGGLLRRRGWAVRGTSRSAAGRAAIEAADLEAADADPDFVGSVVELCADVTVVVWLLAEVGGEAGVELNSERLGSLLHKLVDSPVRGFVFESPADGQGVELVEDAIVRWRLPAEIVQGSRAEPGWAEAVADAAEASVGLG